jgi:hypothetical protein
MSTLDLGKIKLKKKSKISKFYEEWKIWHFQV